MATRIGNWLFHERLTKTMRMFFFSCAKARADVDTSGRPKTNARTIRFIRKYLGFDFDDRGADTVDGCFPVSGKVVTPRRVKVADVSRGFDEHHRSREFQRPLAVVFLNLEHPPVGLHQHDRIALVGSDPEISLRIESRSVGSFEQNTLS